MAICARIFPAFISTYETVFSASIIPSFILSDNLSVRAQLIVFQTSIFISSSYTGKAATALPFRFGPTMGLAIKKKLSPKLSNV